MILLVCAVVIGSILLLFLATALTGAPYVPTQRKELDEAFDVLRPLRAKDTVLDIGSGDGVVLAAAAHRGARAIGYEINPWLVWISRWRLRTYRAHVTVELKNFWTAQFPDEVTLVYTFGETRDIRKMYAKVQSEATRLGRPLGFMSYGFAVPGVELVRQHRAHFLYEVAPLHDSQP